MLKRIVRMEFQSDKVGEFLALFESVRNKIETFPGCNHLELCKDAKLDHVYYTFSRWEDEEALEKYRQSDFFADTWAKTKVLFGGKPVAYSLLEKK